MFGTVLTTTFTLLLAYAVWRAMSVPPFAHRKARLGLAGVGLAAWTVFFLARTYAHDRAGPLAAAIESAGMTLLGSVFLIAMTLAVVDLGTLFGWVFRKAVPRLRGGGIVAGMLLSGLAIVQGHRAPAVVSYDVTLPSLPDRLDGTVIVALSDAHFGPHLGEPWWTERVAEMQTLRPDAVVFLGDMLEGHGDPRSDWPALRELSVPLGKWFVDGNHDSYRGGRAGPGGWERAGFRRLADQWVELTPGLILAGVNDLSRARRRNLPGDPLVRALANRPQGATVLLSHAPTHADPAAEAGVELLLAGHTHGGQIWPFGYLVQRAYPLLAGQHDVGGMVAIVSRGVGTWGPRMRLWHRGEMLKITLHSVRQRERAHAPPGCEDTPP